MIVPRTVAARPTRLQSTDKAPAIRLLVVSTVRIHRLGLVGLLSSVAGVTLIGTARNAEEALASMTTDSYEVVLFDLVSRNCLQEFREFIRSRPATKAVAIGMSAVGSGFWAEAVCAPLALNADLADLIAAIEHVALHRSGSGVKNSGTLAPGRSGTQSDSGSSWLQAGLTTRQAEILQLIDFGLSNRAIALHLHIEEATVKNHVHNILKKLNVPSRGLAAAKFRADRDSLQR
jgi:DNA-binding NarL/FixJ family response regulator